MITDWTLVGDPHATHKSLDRLSQLFGVVESMGRPAIWTGDLLDTKEVIRGKCQNAFFEYFKNSKLFHVILVGNHDWFNLECLDHSLRTLSALPNVLVVDKLTVFEGITFLPYIHDLQKLKEEISKVSTPILVAHLDVLNFDFGNGQMCEKGLDLKDLSKIPLVISGHFHKYQAQSNLVYVGSPFTHSFGESDQTKYIGQLSNGFFSVVKNPLPFHTTYKMNLEQQESILGLDSFVKANSGNFIRVELIGPQSLISGFYRDAYEPLGIRFVPRPTDVEALNVSIDEGLDNSQQFVVWAKTIRKLDQPTVDLGLSILRSLNAK